MNHGGGGVRSGEVSVMKSKVRFTISKVAKGEQGCWLSAGQDTHLAVTDTSSRASMDHRFPPPKKISPFCLSLATAVLRWRSFFFFFFFQSSPSYTKYSAGTVKMIP